MTFSIRPSAAIALLALALCGIDAPAAPVPALRDGQHDFDFNTGVWRTHIRRLSHPFSGSADGVEMTGTVTVRKVWNGRAQLEEIEADGPDGHWQGATLFLYNPQAHQWSQTYFDSKAPVPSTTVGSFGNARGELYAQDTYAGRSILVRGTWSDIAANSHRYEEAYSQDGGKTWETVFSARLERLAP